MARPATPTTRFWHRPDHTFLFLARAFAPILAAKEAAAIIDIHSALSWWAVACIYSATKAALWSATNSLRLSSLPKACR